MRVPMGDDDDDVEKAEEWDSEEEVSIGYDPMAFVDNEQIVAHLEYAALYLPLIYVHTCELLKFQREFLQLV